MTPSTLWGPETGRDSHGYPDMRIQIHADMRIHMDNADTVTEYRYNSRYLYRYPPADPGMRMDPGYLKCYE